MSPRQDLPANELLLLDLMELPFHYGDHGPANTRVLPGRLRITHGDASAPQVCEVVCEGA